jgi:predicted secreted protein
MSTTPASAIADVKILINHNPVPVASTTLSTAAVGVLQSANELATVKGANNRQQMEQDSVVSQRMSSFADNSQDQ